MDGPDEYIQIVIMIVNFEPKFGASSRLEQRLSVPTVIINLQITPRNANLVCVKP
jgi:hypothetical protein